MDEKHLSAITSTKESLEERHDGPSPSPNAPGPAAAPNHDEKLFPWLEVDNGKFSVKRITRFPLMGALGLLGSACTVILSALVLHFFDGKPVITGHMPKPAAWLSIILSLNSVLVHIAVSQGRAVTWWVGATKKKTTVRDLHYIWATENNLYEAITEWRVFNYILFATIMVATLPVNGIILQNAISSRSKVADLWEATTNYSIADHLPSGMTATIDPDGSMDLYRYDWQQAIPLIVGNNDKTFKQSLDTNTTCKGWCEAVVRGIGFESRCEQSEYPTILPLDQQQNLSYTPYNQSAPNHNYTIFDIGINWDHTAPYGWNMTTIWKNDSLCSTNMIQTTCQIQLGSIDYPVGVSFNGSNDGKYDWTLDSTKLPGAGDVSDPTTNFASFGPGTVETVDTNSTYGGFVTAVATYFNSSITLNRNNIENTTELKVNGFYAEQLNTLIDQKSLAYRCNISLNYFGHNGLYPNPYSDLLDSFRDWLFFASIYAMEPNTTIWATEPRPDTQVVHHDIDDVHITFYQVFWSWYYGSVAITFGIVLLIIPTFYGFWNLAKETSLSPFETARAFKTPILLDQPADLDTPELLKTVGQKNLRTELSPPNSPSAEQTKFGRLG